MVGAAHARAEAVDPDADDSALGEAEELGEAAGANGDGPLLLMASLHWDLVLGQSLCWANSAKSRESTPLDGEDLSLSVEPWPLWGVPW